MVEEGGREGGKEAGKERREWAYYVSYTSHHYTLQRYNVYSFLGNILSTAYLSCPLSSLPFPPSRLGYVRVAYVAAFKEIELEFLIKDEDGWQEKLRALREGIGGAEAVVVVPYFEKEEEEREEEEG